MKVAEIQGRTDAELRFDRGAMERELFDLRCKSVTEGLADSSRLGAIKKDIARIETVLRERQIGVRGQEPRQS